MRTRVRRVLLLNFFHYSAHRLSWVFVEEGGDEFINAGEALVEIRPLFKRKSLPVFVDLIERNLDPKIISSRLHKQLRT